MTEKLKEAVNRGEPEGGCHIRMRSSRTDLNGREREQEHVIGASDKGGSKPGPT